MAQQQNSASEGTLKTSQPKTLDDIRNSVANMYKDGKIQEIQKKSFHVYINLKRQGMTDEQAMQTVLSHGVKYNDILQGILDAEAVF